MWRSVFCLLVGVVVVLADDEQSKVVTTASGAVRGFLSQETGVYEFLDIPYATAPTGPNKFKAPLPPPVWHDTIDAVDTGIICPQKHSFKRMFKNKTMDENCLLASVFVPDTEQKKLPVIVYVHGGGFRIGFGNWMKPTNLVKEHKIIAVQFNFRLGAHGFLCLGTEDVPGNAGMKDQVALLRWVQKNIASFGGNPNDVTLAGSSTGGAAVELLMLSKSARGLFNKIIPESGSHFASYAFQSDPLTNAQLFAKYLHFEKYHDIGALEDFYKTQSYDQLNSRTLFFRRDSSNGFAPCIERNNNRNTDEVFLDEAPIEILKKGNYKKVPSLYGFTTLEGAWKIFLLKLWKHDMNRQFSDFLPEDLIFKNFEEKENVANKVKAFYFGNQTIDIESALSYINYYTDINFAYPILKSVNSQVENGNDHVYLYEFTYVDEQTPVVPFTEIRGAEHCAQTKAVMSGNSFDRHSSRNTKKYKKIASKIRHIWANFIKTGKPMQSGSEIRNWPAVSSKSSPYMSLGNEFQLMDSLLEERMAFWEDIYDKHYRKPIPPPQPFSEYSEFEDS